METGSVRLDKPKRKKVTASLAKAPSTPRFNTDIDPVGPRDAKFQRGKRPTRRSSSDEVNKGDKNARMRREEEEATAAREKKLQEKARRRENAARRKRELEMAEEARREARRRRGEEKDAKRPDVDQASGKVGWSSLVTEEEHNEMVERARKRREAKATMQAEEYAEFEAQMRLEDERREKDKERYRKQREKQRMEAKAKKEAAQKVEGVDGKENEEGRQVSEEAEKKRDVKVAAFLKRQEDAARKREEKLEEAALKEKEAQAKRGSGLVKTAEGPTPNAPSSPETKPDAASAIAAGNASSAVQVLRNAAQQKAPNVVSVGLDL